MWFTILKTDAEFTLMEGEEILGPVTQKSAVSMWNEDNPDDTFQRGAKAYELKDWLVRKLNGEVVGIHGFTDYGTHATVGGSKGRRKSGSLARFILARKQFGITDGKPKIAVFMARRGSQATWVQKLVDNGWTLNPTEWEGVPQETIDEFDTYTQEHKLSWGIKKWMDILKFQELVPKEEEDEVPLAYTMSNFAGKIGEAPVTAELVSDDLAESCCGQAKMDFIQSMRRILLDAQQEKIEKVTLIINRRKEGPRKQEMLRLLDRLHENRRVMEGLVETYEHLTDTGTCEEVRWALNRLADDEDDPLQEEAVRILEEWKECEGKE